MILSFFMKGLLTNDIKVIRVTKNATRLWGEAAHAADERE
jgi:hypothetical protein